MADMTPAPLCATGQASTETVARWPAPEEWPADDAPTLTWARFYVQRLRLRVLPTPSPQDRTAYAIYESDRARQTYRDDHGGTDAPEEVASQFWDDAREMANDLRGPIPKIAHGWGDRPVTDANLVAWFTPAQGSGLAARKSQHHLERGICCVLGDRDGIAQVDVDPRHGGDLAGPWASLPGPRVDTPRGGRHVFVDLSTLLRGERVHGSSCVVAPGVDIRSSGTAVLPSGASSPGRAWVGRDAPRPPPLALLRAPPRDASRGAAMGSGPSTPWDADAHGGLGRVAAILASDIGRGDGRTRAAQAIVGILAAPRAVPDDVLDAALAMLVEYGAGRDWAAARVNEECLAWRAALTRGPRDAQFAEEVLTTWVATRDVGPAKKSAAWARSTARSTWKTADRRQDGNAGAEDVGLAALIGQRDADPWADDPPRHARDFAVAAPPPPAALTPAATARSDLAASDHPSSPQALASAADDAVQALASEVSAGDADAQRAKINEFHLRKFLPSIADAYPLESMERDIASTPVRVDHLYPFYDFLTWEPEQLEDAYLATVGHGYGKWLAPALDNISEGDFMALGAAGAKGGKTHYLGQLADGLALGTAARILGVPGYADHPIVLVVWASEMVKDGEVLLRMLGRQYGFDFAAIRKGNVAAESRGVVHMAEKLDWKLTPAQVVLGAREIARRFARDDRNPVGFAMRHVVREIDLGELPNPKGTGRQRVDYRSGPNLVGFLSDGMAIQRRDLAALAGVTEDKVLCLLLLDPGQRFADDAENSKGALDSLLGAIPSRITRRRTGLGGACIMTSDTTKAAARDLDLDRFLSEPSGQKLAADIFAGSQAIMHHCDVFAVCGDDSLGDHFRRTQWVRVLQGRTGASAECFPFAWETHLGRFRPRESQPLRAAPDGPGRGRQGGDRYSGRGVGRRTGGGASPTPAVGQLSPHSGYVSNYVPQRYGPDAD